VVTSRIFKVGSYLKCTMSASGRIWVEWVTVCRQVKHHSIQPTPRSTQPSSLRGRKIKYRPVWLRSRWGTFTCVGWQVTLCDLIWQVMLHSSEMGFLWRAIPVNHFIPSPSLFHCSL